MKILLKQDIDSLGKMGEIKYVKDGYARNFLIPKKMAILATENNIKIAKTEIEKKEILEAKTRKNLNVLSERLNKLTIKFTLKSGEDDKLFGSVTSQMISDAVNSKGYSIDKKEVNLSEPIKHIGNHFVQIKLGHSIEAKIKIKVQSEK